VLLLIGLLVVFGIALPWAKGIDFLDPVMIGAYACLGGLFAAPMAARSFGETRPTKFLTVLGMGLRATAFGEGLVVTMLLLGVGTVNLGRSGSLRLPELDTLADTGLFGLAMALAFSFGAGWLTLRFSANAARRAARAVFLLLAVAFYYESQWLPDIALKGAVVCGVLTVCFAFLLWKEASAS
jgi:hypothetical protein